MLLWGVIPRESGGITLNNIFLISLLFIATQLKADTTQLVQQAEVVSKQEQILSELDLISALKIDLRLKKLEALDKAATNYLLTRNKQCSGEFASLIINEKGEKVYQKKKLTSSERKNCNYMLVNFRINYNRKIFKLRKTYLIERQKQQLEDLENLERTTLSNLERVALKYK